MWSFNARPNRPRDPIFEMVTGELPIVVHPRVEPLFQLQGSERLRC